MRQTAARGVLAVIGQTGRNNVVRVVQQVKQGGRVLRAKQRAVVSQRSGGGRNTATLSQVLSQRSNQTSAGNIVQDFKSDQFIDLGQRGTGRTANAANTSQSLIQDAVARTTGQAATIMQRHNAAPDLDPSTPRTTSARIDQDSRTGTNTVVRRQQQTLKATATAIAGAITQVQGSQAGGIDASSDDAVHQRSTAVSRSQNAQTESQTLAANTTGPVSQTQFGPIRCCSTNESNRNNTFTAHQRSTLTASDPGAAQQDVVVGETGSSGTTTLSQSATVDGETETGTCSGSRCDSTVSEGSTIPGVSTVSSTDVAYAGLGGMRRIGRGTLTLRGVTGNVEKALLFWNGPTNSTDPTVNAAVTFAGTRVRGTNIGFASDNCWRFRNSQSYRADVTSIVRGNGSYSLADFTKGPNVEINGVSLVVFYDDGNAANDRNVAYASGNDSNVASSYDAAGWDVTIPGVRYPGSGTARLDLVVSDGQRYSDDALVLNGRVLVPSGPIFSGDSVRAGPFDFDGSLWDVKSFDITRFVSPGSNSLHLTTGLRSDCLSAVVVAANVPTGAASSR
ncbi:MAG: DUF3344 domain-containing protein [Actinomycetota bacterium]|nr:DUF3344 domain-containing protein [Actinomycetota bacterium]